MKEKIEYLRENTEKCLTVSARIEKQNNDLIIKCKLRFIDRVRFVAISLSTLTDNLAKVLNTLTFKCI